MTEPRPARHTWFKRRPVKIPSGYPVREEWNYQSDGIDRQFEVDVVYGKPLDVLALKSDVLTDLRSRIEAIRDSRRLIYGDDAATEAVGQCPVCDGPTGAATLDVEVYHAQYVSCPACDHRYLARRPKESTLAAFYAKDVAYASTYTGKEHARTRVLQVSLPKAQWMVDRFQRQFGRRPKKVLDVGAGGGHFIAACRELGIEGTGLELSESSRAFAKAMFDLDLIPQQLAGDYFSDEPPDVITLWGLIEHVPHPQELLRQARRLLAPRGGLLVVSSPNWHSLSTAVQRVNLESIIRHLDPLGHVHVFSESSLATILTRHGFALKAVWFFGMDAYELLNQVMERAGPGFSLDRSGDNHRARLIGVLQETIDMAGLSDSVVMAGVVDGPEPA